MFYTLVSRSIITKINCSRDYLNIFLIGSVGYIILHWYLYSEKKEGFVEKIREYLYYMMVVDIVTSYVSVTFYPSKSDKKIESDERQTITQSQQPQMSPEERQLILQRMQNTKKLQQQEIKKSLQKEHDEIGTDQAVVSHTLVGSKNNDQVHEKNKEDQNSASASDVPEKKTKEDSSPNPEYQREKQPKKSIFTKSEESRDLDKLGTHDSASTQRDTCGKTSELKNKKKKDTEISDTELPIFNGQNTRNKNSIKKEESS